MSSLFRVVLRPLGHRTGLFQARFLSTDPTTLVELRAWACANHTEKSFFGVKRAPGKYEWITYGQVCDDITRMRNVLASLGVGKNDKVGVISQNRPEWLVGAMAAAELGAVFVPMYETQKIKDWKFILENSETKVLLASAKAAKNLNDLKTVPTIQHVIELDGGESNPMSYKQLVRHAPANTPVAKVGKDDIAVLIYTSGTTGHPKGVMLSHYNIISNVNSLAERVEGIYSPNDVHFSFLPWAHVYGQTVELYGAMKMGASLGLGDGPETLLDDILVVKPTVLVGVPQLFNRIYAGVKTKIAESSPIRRGAFNLAMRVARERRDELNTKGKMSPLVEAEWNFAEKVVFSKIKERFGGRLKYALSGGAALARDVQEFFGDLGIPVMEGYGLTETSPVCASEKYGLTEELQGGLTAVKDVTIHILEPNTFNHLPTGEQGEICVTGPNVMLGYYKNESATKEAMCDLDGKRCFRTGDLGRLDEKGVLTITGRIKEQYKLENGKYVVPGIVENALMHSRFIAQVFVYGSNRPYNVAIVVPDFKALAVALNSETVDPEAIMTKHGKAVREIIQDEISTQNKTSDVKHYEQVKNFLIVTDPFTLDNGMLTPKLSMKRPVIQERYASELDKLYDAGPKDKVFGKEL